MNVKMNYTEMYEYVDEHRRTVETEFSYLKERWDKLVALDNEKLKPRIFALDLILNGIRNGEKVTQGAETEDQTDCKCGMEIRIEDLGGEGDELVKRTKILILAWSEYQTKITILKGNYDETVNGELSPTKLALILE